MAVSDPSLISRCCSWIYKYTLMVICIYDFGFCSIRFIDIYICIFETTPIKSVLRHISEMSVAQACQIYSFMEGHDPNGFRLQRWRWRQNLTGSKKKTDRNRSNIQGFLLHLFSCPSLPCWRYSPYQLIVGFSF